MSLSHGSNLELLAAWARKESGAYAGEEPQAGDLVVEVSGLRKGTDPDSIGLLLGHGIAPYREDGRGPSREVWDVVPLSLARGLDGLPYQRWENARFRVTRVKPPRLRYLRAFIFDLSMQDHEMVLR